MSEKYGGRSIERKKEWTPTRENDDGDRTVRPRKEGQNLLPCCDTIGNNNTPKKTVTKSIVDDHTVRRPKMKRQKARKKHLIMLMATGQQQQNCTKTERE